MNSEFKMASRLQSWNPKNLYNLWRRSLGAKVSATDYTRTTKTLFQQRWAAKQLVRAYHGDYINEKTFKRWYLPANLPDVRLTASLRDDSLLLTKWANKASAVEKELKRRDEEASKGLAPVGSLMFSEVERRIDVVIFRSCLAHSVYEARRMVVHGNVLLNGNKVSRGNVSPELQKGNRPISAPERKHPTSAGRHGHGGPSGHQIPAT